MVKSRSPVQLYVFADRNPYALLHPLSEAWVEGLCLLMDEPVYPVDNTTALKAGAPESS